MTMLVSLGTTILEWLFVADKLVLPNNNQILMLGLS